jgi:DNA polymerase-3 subunit beta
MRVSVVRKELEDVLKKSRHAIQKKVNMPILNNLKLSAKEDKLSIYITNLESFLVVELPARVEEAGTAAVHASKLTSIVEELPSAEVYMELVEGKLIIRGGKSQFKLVCADPSEFPEFPEVQCKSSIPNNLLLKGISKVGYAISKDEMMNALHGMYVASKEDKLHFVGSDGYRLALYMHEGNLEDNLLFPRNSLKLLEKLLEDAIGEVEVGKDENFAHVKGENWSLSVRLLEGEYPDYMAVIPTDYTLSVMLDKAEFENALQRLSSISSSKGFPVKLTISSDVVRVEISDPEFGEGKDEVDVLEYFGNSEPMEIGFNGKYLLEALGEFDFERVYLKVIDPDSPAVLESANPEKEPYLCIIMPMRL